MTRLLLSASVALLCASALPYRVRYDLPAIPSPATPEYVIPAEYQETVEAAAHSAGVPLWIFARLIARESGYDPSAVNINRRGRRVVSCDLGIAQLNDQYLPDFEWFDNGGRPFNPMNPDEALPVAARYLARMYRATGSWRLAVAAYNCGLSRLQAGGMPERTVEHVEAVMQGVDV